MKGRPLPCSPSRSRHSQHGSMAVTMMLMLLGLIAMLGIVEVGYLYWAKRDTQKVADMAALSGAQQLTGPDCPAPASTAYVAAAGNAIDNGGTTANGFSIDISCGRQPASGSSMLAPASAGSVAAIKVVATRNVPSIFGMAWKSTIPVKAEAVAVDSDPIASFSVGSSLAGIDSNSPLSQLLDTALGTSLGLQLLSYQGIANTDISLLDLVNQLNINAGTVDGVLDAPITVSDFLDAYVQALDQSSNAANIDLGFVNAQVASIEAQIGDTALDLGDILDVNPNTTDLDAALNTNVNALDILSAVLLAADSKNGVALPATTISVPPIANVNLMMSIVEPPQIGVGGIGTTVHTAQVRLYLDVTALNGTTLGGDESLLDIPLYLEVAPTDATLTGVECSTDTATITVTPGVLNAFLGTMPSSAFSNTSQTWQSLTGSGQMAPLVDVDLLGIPVAQLLASSSIQLATNPSASCTLQEGQEATCPPADGQSTNVLATAVTSLLSSSHLQTDTKILGGLGGINLGPLLSGLSDLLQPVLPPLFETLDTALVSPLLKMLGVELGYAEVKLIKVDCNAGPQLVY